MAEEDKLTPYQVAAAKARRMEAMALAEIEGNPLMLADTELFELYEREGWTHARRLKDLKERLAVHLDPPEPEQ